MKSSVIIIVSGRDVEGLSTARTKGVWMVSEDEFVFEEFISREELSIEEVEGVEDPNKIECAESSNDVLLVEDLIVDLWSQSA